MSIQTKSRKAVFFDRDGVLIKVIMRNNQPGGARHLNEIVIIPGAAEAVRLLSEAGFLLFIVTNQPDIARGQLTLTQAQAVNETLVKALGREHIQKVYLCPHDHADHCICRKPKPGMLLEAASSHQVDLLSSYLIGDREVDMLAAKAAKVKPVLVRAPYNLTLNAYDSAQDVLEASRWIVSQ